MYRHILIATDGSRLSDKAVKSGVALAKAVGARVTLFHAYPQFRLFNEGYTMPDVGQVKEYFMKEAHIEAQKIVSRAARSAQKAGVSCDTVTRETDSIYEGIIDTAKRKRCDLIVMASHGRRGLSGLLIGSETAKVLTHSATPVLVVR